MLFCRTKLLNVLVTHYFHGGIVVTRKLDVLAVQNSVVVVQKNGKGKTKKRAARAICFFAN